MLRKTLLSTLIAATFGLAAIPQAEADTTLTFVSWGGAYQESQQKAYLEPYMEANPDVDFVEANYSGGLAEVTAQVQTGQVSWDIIDVELPDAIRGCDEGLFVEVDHSDLPPAPDGTPAEEDFLPSTLQDCAVGVIVWMNIIAYDSNKCDLQSAADFFDLQECPGKRGFWKNPKTSLEFALLADGVPPEEVYDVLSTEEGVDRAFAKLDTIKDSIVWWTAGAQPPQLLADGEVVATTAYNGRIFDLQNTGKDNIKILWSGVQEADLLAILEGSDNVEEAWEFIKFASSTQPLADQAKYISYGPARQSSIPLIGKHAETGIDMMPHMPTTPEHLANTVEANPEFWADNQVELDKRFNTWLAQ